jgi:hypothetical protein
MGKRPLAFILTLLMFCFLSCSNNEDIGTETQVVVKPELYPDIPMTDDNLSDADYISLQPAVYNNTLRVQVNYRHKEDDSIIIWSGEDVTCLYTIYKTDYLGSSKKMGEILNGEKILKRADQAFYIDTDQFETGNYYLIVCIVDTGYVKLEPYDTFFYSKNS